MFLIQSSTLKKHFFHDSLIHLDGKVLISIKIDFFLQSSKKEAIDSLCQKSGLRLQYSFLVKRILLRSQIRIAKRVKCEMRNDFPTSDINSLF